MIRGLLSGLVGVAGRSLGSIGGVLTSGPLLWLVVAAFAGLATSALISRTQLAGVRAELAQAHAAHASYALQVQIKAQAAAESARQREHQLLESLAALQSQRDQENADAETRIAALSADMRTGAVRVRREICDPIASGGDRVPVTAAARSRGDGPPELRGHPAALAVGAGARADTQIRYLQSVILSYRKTCNG